MSRIRNRIPYKKPVEVFIADSEFAEIMAGLDWGTTKEKRDCLDKMLDQVPNICVIEQSFYSMWGKTKENLAIFRHGVDSWFEDAIDQIDWKKVDGEKLWDIKELLDKGIDPEYEIFERWGVSKENRALIEAERKSRDSNDDYTC